MLGYADDYDNLKEMLDKARDIVYTIDLIPSFRFTYINNAIYDILGYSSDEILNKPNIPFKIIHKDEKKYLIDKIKGNADYSKPTTLRFISKNGVCKWLEDRVVPRYNKNGELIGVSGISRDVTEQKELELELKRLKNRDDLTEVYSRYFFNNILSEIDGKIGQVGIILIDIDKLKNVNDTFGHLNGDKFILLVAKTLEKHVKDAGYVCRHGGDEFVIILKDKNIEECMKYYEELKKENIYFQGKERSFSIGFAHSNGKFVNIKNLLEEADEKMYKHKLQGQIIPKYI